MRVSRSNLPQVSPVCAVTVPFAGSTKIPFMRDKAVIDHGEAGCIMSAAPNSWVNILIYSEPNSRPDVCRAGTSSDGGWPAIDHRVPDSATRLIIRRPSGKNLSTKLCLKSFEVHVRLRDWRVP